jgi:putative transcriptional regulator
MRGYARTTLPLLQCLVMLFCIVPAARAASIEEPVLLVATDRLSGSPYRETVLIVAPVGGNQHVGLIVNRPTDARLGTLFPRYAPAQKIVDPLFFGGPELTGAVFAAVRSAEPPSEFSLPLMPGLFLVTDAETVDRIMETVPNDARYFTGLVVWEPSELALEIDSGLWHVRNADPHALFDAQPLQLWHELAPGGSGIVALN